MMTLCVSWRRIWRGRPVTITPQVEAARQRAMRLVNQNERRIEALERTVHPRSQRAHPRVRDLDGTPPHRPY